MPDRAPGVLSRAGTRHLGVRFARYAVGSLVAVITSEVAFVLCYGSGRVGTTASSAIAFVAGAIPNYVLNRSWAWGRRGRLRVGREVVLYIVLSLAGFGASALATGWAGRLAPRLTSGHDQRTALVAGAYLATYSVLFVLKFAVYQLVVFTGPRRPGAPATTSS